MAILFIETVEHAPHELQLAEAYKARRDLRIAVLEEHIIDSLYVEPVETGQLAALDEPRLHALGLMAFQEEASLN